MESSANLIKNYQEEIHIASGKIGHLREIVNREKNYFRDEPKIFYFSNDNTNKREKNIRWEKQYFFLTHDSITTRHTHSPLPSQNPPTTTTHDQNKSFKCCNN